MKTLKRIVSLTLSFILLLSFALPAFSADEAGITSLSATITVDEKALSVSWWEAAGKYYLFLPSDADLSAVTLSFSAAGAVNLDGKELQNNSVVTLEAEKIYTLTCGNNSYPLKVLKSENLPSLHITTASGSLDAIHADKSHKEEASIIIASEGEVILEKDLEYIKGRGNATWTYDKRPYNIKFDKKTDLFGMGKAKKWTLLANYVDKTTLRNRAAYTLAEKMGIAFTSKHVSVDLYINNEYYGNYVLCESVEVGETRVDISDLEGATEDVNPDQDLDEFPYGGDHTVNFYALKPGTQKWFEIPENPENITGGYLLEYELPDRYISEPSGFVTDRNQTIVIKSPEYASEAQVKYISSLYQKFEDAVYSDTGYNSEGKHFSEYIDVESFINVYIFQEFAKNLDAAVTSFYIYKDADSDKFVAGPVWDFDRAFGDEFIRFGMNNGIPEGWWAGIIYHFNGNLNTTPTILNALYKQDTFFSDVCARWETVSSDIITEDYFAEVDDLKETVTSSAVMNAIRWNYFASSDTQTVKDSYSEFTDRTLLDFIKNRKAFLDRGFADTSVRVFYNNNGGYGNMYNESAPQLADTFTLPACTFTHSTLVFDSWNTKADGSGTKYNPGDTLVLDNTKMVFFAQWKEKDIAPSEPEIPTEPSVPEEETQPGFFEKIIQSIRDFFNRIREFFMNLF